MTWHGEEDVTKATEVGRDAHARRGQAQEHPDGRVPVGARQRRSSAPSPCRLRAPQPRPRPAARLARQGRAGLERPRRPRAAALHPGEGAPQGADRRPAARRRKEREPRRAGEQLDLFADFNGMPEGRGQDRVLPARPELVEPHDPRRLAPGDGEPCRARGSARQGAVHLHRPAVRDQVQQQLPVVHDEPRREGRQRCAHHARAGAGQGVPRHLARRHPQLPDLPARPADRRARSAYATRDRSSSRSATRMSIAFGR